MEKDLDPHKDDVYRWEETWPGWSHNHLNLRQCRELIRMACDHYKVKCPTVTQHKGGTWAWSAPTLNRISMQGGEHMRQGSRNVPIVMHEVAHHIAWNLHGERIQDHGQTWLGIYLNLLVIAKVAPRLALEATLRSFNLKWKSNDSRRIQS
jgi:hypothetical protein